MHPTRLVTASRLAVTALPALALLAGCAATAGTETRYVKPGTTAATRPQDQIECLRAATRVDDKGYLLLPFAIDRPAFDRCMRARGYSTTDQGTAAHTAS